MKDITLRIHENSGDHFRYRFSFELTRLEGFPEFSEFRVGGFVPITAIEDPAKVIIDTSGTYLKINVINTTVALMSIGDAEVIRQIEKQLREYVHRKIAPNMWISVLREWMHTTSKAFEDQQKRMMEALRNTNRRFITTVDSVIQAVMKDGAHVRLTDCTEDEAFEAYNVEGYVYNTSDGYMFFTKPIGYVAQPSLHPDFIYHIVREEIDEALYDGSMLLEVIHDD